MRRVKVKRAGALRAMFTAKRALREIIDPRRRRWRKLRDLRVRGPLIEQNTLSAESRIEAGW